MPGFLQIGRHAAMRGLVRSTVVACLLAGVVLAGVGSDVVSTEASASIGVLILCLRCKRSFLRHEPVMA